MQDSLFTKLFADGIFFLELLWKSISQLRENQDTYLAEWRFCKHASWEYTFLIVIQLKTENEYIYEYLMIMEYVSTL